MEIGASDIFPLCEMDYYDYLIEELPNAKNRIWISLFKVEIKSNPDDKVMELINLLIKCKKAGIDIRVIIAASNSHPTLLISQISSYNYFDTKRIPVKFYNLSGRRIQNSHSKYILIDNDITVLGTHNWSTNSLFHNIEDSICIKSSEMNTQLAGEFLKSWRYSFTMDNFISNFKLSKRYFFLFDKKKK